MTVRNRDTKASTPKAVGKQKATNEYLAALALPVQQMDAVPDLITQRCLEALTYIVSANELSSLFFLTEHDLPLVLRKATTKKGKGKEKQTTQTHYPLVLLLNLLDRQSLLRTPAILESVVGFLATVTRPLTTLKDKIENVEVGPSGTPSLLENVTQEGLPTITAVQAAADPTVLSGTLASEAVVDSSTQPMSKFFIFSQIPKPHI